MSIEGMIGGKSLSKIQKAVIENDPLEAIFALNLGDFLTDTLISDELLSKVSSSVQDKIIGLKNQLKELISIYSLDKTLTLLGFNSEDDFILYNSISKTIAQMLGVSACHIYLTQDYIKSSNNKEFDLTLIGSSLEDLDIENKNIGYSINDKLNPPLKAYLAKKTVYLKNTKKSKNWKAQPELKEDNVTTFLAVPMANNYEKVGILCIENYNNKEILPDHIRLVEVTASLFVTSMRLQKLVEEAEFLINDENVSPMELRRLRTELTVSIGDLGDEQQLFVESLASSVDLKSKFSQSHSQKVAYIAKEIAEYLKLNEKTTDLIYYAGLLQNIGKITLPDEIFSNKGKLSGEDWLKLQNHPNVGVNLLMKINFLSEVVPYVHYHRERWDGQGIPEGLSGMSIPLGSRIIAVADAYQAMISERPYRQPLTNQEVLDILKEEAGSKWDPTIVDALIAIKSPH